jgi:polyisoprenoid-binding protein YceI
MPYQIDRSHTSIQFSARHMMISKVRGSFDQFEGQIELNEENPELTTVSVTIDAASINTRDPQRDGHLRAPDFLNTDVYPSITFRSTRVERTGSKTAKLYGDLTIRDVTNPVVVDVEYVGTSVSPWGATAFGFEGSTRINRKDWGLVWNVALETGGVLVSDEIAINLELEVVKVPEAQPEAPVEAVAG